MVIRTEREYRELIHKAVFWLARWPGWAPTGLERDLAKLMEILDEDIAEAFEKLVKAVGKNAN